MEIAKLLYLPKKFVHSLEVVFHLYRKKANAQIGSWEHSRQIRCKITVGCLSWRNLILANCLSIFCIRLNSTTIETPLRVPISRILLPWRRRSLFHFVASTTCNKYYWSLLWYIVCSATLWHNLTSSSTTTCWCASLVWIILFLFWRTLMGFGPYWNENQPTFVPVGTLYLVRTYFRVPKCSFL